MPHTWTKFATFCNNHGLRHRSAGDVQFAAVSERCAASFADRLLGNDRDQGRCVDDNHQGRPYSS